jgi:hypothetical protein
VLCLLLLSFLLFWVFHDEKLLFALLLVYTWTYFAINSKTTPSIDFPSRAALALSSRRTDSGTLRMIIAAAFSSPSTWWIFAAVAPRAGGVDY